MQNTLRNGKELHENNKVLYFGSRKFRETPLIYNFFANYNNAREIDLAQVAELFAPYKDFKMILVAEEAFCYNVSVVFIPRIFGSSMAAVL